MRFTVSALLGSLLALASCRLSDEQSEPSLELQLIHAIWTGQAEVVESVLRRGANPNATVNDAYGVRSDSDGQGESTPLFLAMETPLSERIVKALLAFGANPDRVDSRGEAPLARVIGNPKHERIALALIATMKDVRGQVLVRGAVNDFWVHRTSYLHAAVGSSHVVTALLDKGANPRESDELGDTPLHAAVRAKEYKTVKLLLEKGSAPNAQDSRGRTPLYWTTNAWYAELRLRQEGDPPTLPTALARSAGESAEERDVQIQRLLTSAGAKK